MPTFKNEADNAGAYPSRRFGQRERKLLETVQEAYPFGCVAAAEFTTVGGSATQTITVPGVLASDIVIASLAAQGGTPRTILTAATTADTITVVMSGDPSATHVISYAVFRAQA